MAGLGLTNALNQYQQGVAWKQNQDARAKMMERQKDKNLAQLREALPKTWSSPTMSPTSTSRGKFCKRAAWISPLFSRISGATQPRPRKA